MSGVPSRPFFILTNIAALAMPSLARDTPPREGGGALVTGSFMDYALPRADHMPVTATHRAWATEGTAASGRGER